MISRDFIKDKKRIVIKVGSSSLTHESTGHISLTKMERLIRQISDIKHMGKDVVVVSSGAQAVGVSALNLKGKPSRMDKKQAVAAVGQSILMNMYQKLFREYNIVPGQVLITKDVVSEPIRRDNATNTFRALLEYDVIPVVNENDTVSTDEIEFGDNDTLSAVVAELIEADLLILLSDIDGLYDSDPNNNPRAELVDVVEEVNEQILRMATGSATLVGTGGMVTKLQAAMIANKANIDMVIANSTRAHVVTDIMNGDKVGTLFMAAPKKGV